MRDALKEYKLEDGQPNYLVINLYKKKYESNKNKISADKNIMTQEHWLNLIPETGWYKLERIKFETQQWVPVKKGKVAIVVIGSLHDVYFPQTYIQVPQYLNIQQNDLMGKFYFIL